MSTDNPFKKKQQWISNKKDDSNRHRDEEEMKTFAKAIYGAI
jgi:hypothetical protein